MREARRDQPRAGSVARRNAVRPLVVLEGDARADAARVVQRLRTAGWTVVESWTVAGGVPPGAQIACVGCVHNIEDAERAVLSAVWGAALVIEADAPRDVIDRLCEDLRRLGDLDHRAAPDRTPELSAEEHELLRLLADGVTLGEAAGRLHLSRRTADRRLASIRERLGVSTTAEALVAARRLGLLR